MLSLESNSALGARSHTLQVPTFLDLKVKYLPPNPSRQFGSRAWPSSPGSVLLM